MASVVQAEILSFRQFRPRQESQVDCFHRFVQPPGLHYGPGASVSKQRFLQFLLSSSTGEWPLELIFSGKTRAATLRRKTCFREQNTCKMLYVFQKLFDFFWQAVKESEKRRFSRQPSFSTSQFFSSLCFRRSKAHWQSAGAGFTMGAQIERRFFEVFGLFSWPKFQVKQKFQLDEKRKEVNKVQSQITEKKKASKGQDKCSSLRGWRWSVGPMFSKVTKRQRWRFVGAKNHLGGHRAVANRESFSVHLVQGEAANMEQTCDEMMGQRDKLLGSIGNIVWASNESWNPVLPLCFSKVHDTVPVSQDEEKDNKASAKKQRLNCSNQ